MKRSRRLAASLAIAAAVTAPAALAAGPSSDQYSNPISTESPPASNASLVTTRAGGELPFTGLELTAAVVVAAGLTGTGLVLRRAGRRSRS